MNHMFTSPQSRRKAIYAAIVSTIVTVSTPAIVAATGSANPCAARRILVAASTCNPCNPCAVKKCNPCNPCAARKCSPCNPCAAKNPCNPCNPCAGKLAAGGFMRPAGTKPYSGNADALLAEGKRLWNDTSLSTNGLSCETCHTGGAAFNQTFAKPYPHQVAMPSQQSGVGEIRADEMVQFCLRVPMQAKALPWESRELAALTAYTVALQKRFQPNPCAAKSPCNPCNPCAAKKPCNPCNPCAVKKCNPCKSSGVTVPDNAMAVKKNS